MLWRPHARRKRPRQGDRETSGIPLDAEIFALGTTGSVEVVAKLRWYENKMLFGVAEKKGLV